jgi:hypothetical protein
MQEREDDNGELLAKKRAREANCGTETFDEWFARYFETKECGDSYRDASNPRPGSGRWRERASSLG